MKKDKKKEPCGLRAISLAIYKASPRKKDNKKRIKSVEPSEMSLEPAIRQPGSLRKALKLEKEVAIPAKKLKGTSLKKGRKRARPASTLRKLNKKRRVARRYR